MTSVVWRRHCEINQQKRKYNCFPISVPGRKNSQALEKQNYKSWTRWCNGSRVFSSYLGISHSRGEQVRYASPFAIWRHLNNVIIYNIVRYVLYNCVPRHVQVSDFPFVYIPLSPFNYKISTFLFTYLLLLLHFGGKPCLHIS